MVSVGTVVALVPVVPQALSLRSPTELEREIEQRKEAEESLLKSERRFQRAIAGTTAGIWEWDLRTNSLWQSKRCIELLGGGERVSGWTFDTFLDSIHPDDVETVKQSIDEQLVSGNPGEFEYRFLISGSESRWFESRCIAFHNQQGEPIYLSGSTLDINDRKQTQEALEESEQEIRHQQKMEAVGSLAGGVAHEFNNMLQAIRGYVTFAQGALPPGETRDDLEQALVATSRATMLTRQLLDFSRRDEFSQQSLSVCKLISDLVGITRPLIGEHITLNVPKHCLDQEIQGDPNQLLQALMNICVNARDAMPEGGTLGLATDSVTIGASEDFLALELAPGRYVKICISDTGHGISEETLSHVFEPFFTTKPVGQGTGLGLSIVYTIIEKHGGAIRAVSERGHGTTFEIYLPATTTEDNEIPGPAIPDSQQSLSGGGTVLLAEDNNTVRSVELRILRQAGYHILEADNGQTAIDLFRKHADEIDLVVLDVVMPHKSGHEACESIRHIRPEVPVLFCTGYDPKSANRDRLTINGHMVIDKPFSIDQFLTAVQNILRVPVASR